jgi:hypothetical protein
LGFSGISGERNCLLQRLTALEFAVFVRIQFSSEIVNELFGITDNEALSEILTAPFWS